MTRGLRIVILSLLAATVGGCRIPPVRTVNFRVLEERPDGSAGDPIAGAHFRAVPMGTGPVPLPVSRATLEQSTWARDATAATDKNGRVRLRIYKKAAHLVEVGPLPKVGDPEPAGVGPWAWTLSIDGKTLTPSPRNGATNQPGVLLQIEPRR